MANSLTLEQVREIRALESELFATRESIEDMHASFEEKKTKLLKQVEDAKIESEAIENWKLAQEAMLNKTAGEALKELMELTDEDVFVNDADSGSMEINQLMIEVREIFYENETLKEEIKRLKKGAE